MKPEMKALDKHRRREGENNDEKLKKRKGKEEENNEAKRKRKRCLYKDEIQTNRKSDSALERKDRNCQLVAIVGLKLITE